MNINRHLRVPFSFSALRGIGLEMLEKVQTLEGEEALMTVENLPKPSEIRKLP